MGIISHNVIICVSQVPENFAAVVALAREIFPPDQISVQGPVINGYRTLFIGPDGSKEGWKDSDEGDRRREKFLQALKSDEYRLDEWLEVVFGELGTSIVDAPVFEGD
jgi:hypothetical protein